MTDLPVRARNCGECAYWQKLRETDGLCRRYAPEAGGNSEQVSRWPQTHIRQGCGEGIVAAARPGAACAMCAFWRRSEGGLNPIDRGDMLMTWWTHAGHCVRHAPRPGSEPGLHAFWKATADTDGCGEGEARDQATHRA